MAISPFTKPGTHVVCVYEAVMNVWTLEKVKKSPIKLGEVYVVENIVRTILGVYAVELVGHNFIYLLEMFEPAVLPKQITEILDKADKPIDGVSPELETVDG